MKSILSKKKTNENRASLRWKGRHFLSSHMRRGTESRDGMKFNIASHRQQRHSHTETALTKKDPPSPTHSWATELGATQGPVAVPRDAVETALLADFSSSFFLNTRILIVPKPWKEHQWDIRCGPKGYQFLWTKKCVNFHLYFWKKAVRFQLKS